MQLEDINLLNRDVFAEGVPHHWFTYLRAHHPFFKHPEPNGPGFWVATKHSDVQTITRDPGTFSSHTVSPLEEYPERDAQEQASVIIQLDPPEHTAFRKMIN